MKKLLYLLLFSFVAILSNCKDDNSATDAVAYGFPSFLEKYYIPASIKLQRCVTYEDIPYIIMECDDGGKSYSFDAKDEKEMATFERYAKAFGDTLFSEIHHSWDYIASVMPLVSMNVTTDRVFDAKHPADSLINDLIDIYIWKDFKTVIAITEDLEHHKNEDVGLLDYYRNLDSIPDSPISMFPDWFRLHFKKNPDTLGTYNFTISMKFGADPVTGETVEIAPVTVEMEFK